MILNKYLIGWSLINITLANEFYKLYIDYYGLTSNNYGFVISISVSSLLNVYYTFCKSFI